MTQHRFCHMMSLLGVRTDHIGTNESKRAAEGRGEQWKRVFILPSAKTETSELHGLLKYSSTLLYRTGDRTGFVLTREFLDVLGFNRNSDHVVQGNDVRTRKDKNRGRASNDKRTVPLKDAAPPTYAGTWTWPLRKWRHDTKKQEQSSLRRIQTPTDASVFIKSLQRSSPSSDLSPRWDRKWTDAGAAASDAASIKKRRLQAGAPSNTQRHLGREGLLLWSSRNNLFGSSALISKKEQSQTTKTADSSFLSAGWLSRAARYLTCGNLMDPVGRSRSLWCFN